MLGLLVAFLAILVGFYMLPAVGGAVDSTEINSTAAAGTPFVPVVLLIPIITFFIIFIVALFGLIIRRT